MHRIAREKQKFECLEVTRSFAPSVPRMHLNWTYLIVFESEPITVFRNGHFVDLCRRHIFLIHLPLALLKC